MRNRLSSQAGFTLIELLIAMAIFIGILSATLTTFVNFQRNSSLSQKRNVASDRVRLMADSLTRDLRNLADPTTEAKSIELKLDTDLVFRSVDPKATGTDPNRVGVQRVRYCLASTGLVYRSTQRWTTLISPSAPSTSACGPTDAWTGACVAASTCERTVVAEHVTNNRVTPRALFTYDNAAADSVTFIRVHANLDINDATAGPAEIALESGVTLRNQNRRPTAVLDPPVSSGNSDFVLNASSSSDPEGALLTYEFLVGVSDTPLGSPQISPTLTATFAPGSQTVRVRVKDPGGLSALSASYTVTVTP